ncbi:transmembrane protease serine 9 isoform X2 [Eurytemora carolleeae]|uniref:transmembrane protease serine 9 isoform X2 n=1 Tax=Eurytemora carolleeae TaxID=1294199 RepID=UPI000C75F4EB|nr:transmembrane protease serine 9 isoform X2 [Eurytemora carolleeae]|eukprot:XP_023345598.1 transmembrane protease serine 9-like isoform X2 [Eurytemora affinis]
MRSIRPTELFFVVGFICETGLVWTQECGRIQSTEKNKIVGGTDTAEGEFPWMTMLEVHNTFLCGGTILDRTHILTAAHCLILKDGEIIPAQYLSVHTGRHFLLNGGIQTIVKKINVHNAYDMQTNVNDIAILELTVPLNFTDTTAPICLPKPSLELEYNTLVVAAGWGRLQDNGNISTSLQKVNLNIFSQKACINMYEGYKAVLGIQNPVLKTNLCTLNTDGRDACQGDSGGPLLLEQNGKYVQVGVTSWGVGCANPKYPGIWTNVPKYVPWIEQITRFNQNDRLSPPPSVFFPPQKKSPYIFQNCEIATFRQQRIIGGLKANPEEFPWMVLTLVKDFYPCGGTIISRTFILTAGHCIFNEKSKVKYDVGDVVVNARRFYTFVGGEQFKVKNIFLHNLFNPVTNEYDIALLELTKPMEFSQSIEPVCLPSADHKIPLDGEFMAAGWGMINITTKKKDSFLQKVNLTIYPLQDCINLYKNENTIKKVTPQHLCTLRKGKDVCRGDSGGPLFLRENGIYIQIGISSWGTECANSKYPAVFINVHSFSSWIENIVTNDTTTISGSTTLVTSSSTLSNISTTTTSMSPSGFSSHLPTRSTSSSTTRSTSRITPRSTTTSTNKSTTITTSTTTTTTKSTSTSKIRSTSRPTSGVNNSSSAGLMSSSSSEGTTKKPTTGKQSDFTGSSEQLSYFSSICTLVIFILIK